MCSADGEEEYEDDKEGEDSEEECENEDGMEEEVREDDLEACALNIEDEEDIGDNVTVDRGAGETVESAPETAQMRSPIDQEKIRQGQRKMTMMSDAAKKRAVKRQKVKDLENVSLFLLCIVQFSVILSLRISLLRRQTMIPRR